MNTHTCDWSFKLLCAWPYCYDGPGMQLKAGELSFGSESGNPRAPRKE